MQGGVRVCGTSGQVKKELIGMVCHSPSDMVHEGKGECSFRSDLGIFSRG